MIKNTMIFTVMRSLTGAREETGLGRAAGVAKMLSGLNPVASCSAQAAREVRVAHGLLTQ